MLRDGPLRSLNLKHVLPTREQRWISIAEAAALPGVNRS
jgi:hypothetical protein